MNDYIRREAANALIRTVFPRIEDRVDINCVLNSVPASDVVEAVRCQDCKWYKEGKLFAPKKFCFRLRDKDGKHIGYNFAPDDFCSYGERKGGTSDDLST